MIPEFVGRLPVMATLEELDGPALIRILTEPRNALVKQYQKFFQMEGSEVEFTEPALREIARIAKQKETGARGLRSVIEQVMFDIMYELPERPRGGRYVITPEVVRGEQNLFPQDGSAAA
jgi:ATP-dependent Clp protease ATP-binding subunit ClpX